MTIIVLVLQKPPPPGNSNLFCGWSVDIFWNCTISKEVFHISSMLVINGETDQVILSSWTGQSHCVVFLSKTVQSNLLRTPFKSGMIVVLTEWSKCNQMGSFRVVISVLFWWLVSKSKTGFYNKLLVCSSKNITKILTFPHSVFVPLQRRESL